MHLLILCVGAVPGVMWSISIILTSFGRDFRTGFHRLWGNQGSSEIIDKCLCVGGKICALLLGESPSVFMNFSKGPLDQSEL